MAATALNGHQIGGIVVDVQLHSPWPTAADNEETGDSYRRESFGGRRRPEELKVLTSGQLTPTPASDSRESEDIMEFSFTEQQQ